MDIGGFFSWKCILHVYIYISIFKCDSFFTHINERGTNKLPPTRRVQERSKGDTTCQITSQNPSCWHPSCLSNACTTRKDSESEWLAKDNPETNPITIKPETAELFSWIPLFYCSPPGFPFPKNLLLCQHMCLLGQFISESLTRAQFQALEAVPLPATVSHQAANGTFMGHLTHLVALSIFLVCLESSVNLESNQSQDLSSSSITKVCKKERLKTKRIIY